MRGSRSDDLGLELALVGERDLHVGHALDDVMVGDDEAGRIDDHAGAERLLHALILASAAAKKPAEDRIVEQGIARHRLDARGVDVDDRGRDLLDHRRQGETRAALRRNLRRRVGDGRGAEQRKHRSEGEADQSILQDGFVSAADIVRRRAGCKAAWRRAPFPGAF